MEIVCLMENTMFKSSLASEYGLSLLIKDEKTILSFDIGQTFFFISNARKMGEDLNKVSHVILSHGHYDHTHISQHEYCD